MIYDNGNVRRIDYVDGIIASSVINEADGDERITLYGANGNRESFTFVDGSDTRKWASYTNTYDENGDFLMRDYAYDAM
jgi:hypothetical protein